MSSKLKRLIPALLVLVLAAAALVFFLMRQEISFADGDSLASYKVFMGSSLSFPEENCPEGYIFAGWRDENGVLHNEESITVRESGCFTAEYRILFKRHSDEPFIFSEEDGFFNIGRPVNRGELIAILSCYFTVNADDSVSFADINTKDDYYEAACALKALGIYTEDELKPDTVITGEELSHVLSFFHTDSAFSSDELPSGELSMLELIKAVSLASGCTGPESVPAGLRGAVPDLSPEDDSYAFALEAAVKHSHSNGLCDWSDFEAIRSFEAGLFDINNALYYAYEDGSLARDEEAVGLYFGEDGRYTTGMAELDELVLKILGELVNDEMSNLDKLKAAYYYVLDNSKYIKGNIYERGETGWCEEEGYSMLSRGYGNCYGYAAAFCQLARAIGYDAHAFSGYMGADYDPHGWVEIEIDGENYYFDPQLEMSCRMRHEYDSLFMVSEISSHKWSYVH